MSRIVAISEAGRAPKHAPAIFALVLAAGHKAGGMMDVVGFDTTAPTVMADLA